MTVRLLGAVAVAVSVATLAACTETTGGLAVRAPTNPNDAIVALMDTGSYPTTAGPPPGNAGRDPSAAAVVEARRMAQYVVGPWQVDATLVQQHHFATSPLATPGNLSAALAYPLSMWPGVQQFADIGVTHHFVAGLTTGRVGTGIVRRLQNAVMRFPDPDSAAAAAREMAAVNPSTQLEPVSWFPRPTALRQPLDSAWRPEACAEVSSNPVHPEFAASASTEGRGVLRTFTAHGSYVFYQFVIAGTTDVACTTVVDALVKQEAMIDQFVPTEPAKMAELPRDPSGQLAARTLWAVDGRGPWSEGVWQPDAWLHFEYDPVKAAALFTAAGIDWVSQRLTTVYQARDAAGATRVVDQFTAETNALLDVKSTAAGVPGFPGAACFNRAGWTPGPATDLTTVTQSWWHFKCIAQAGRYAFVAVSDQEKDVKQQISAQDRILAGE